MAVKWGYIVQTGYHYSWLLHVSCLLKGTKKRNEKFKAYSQLLLLKPESQVNKHLPWL
jgi:hypothetical protein